MKPPALGLKAHGPLPELAPDGCIVCGATPPKGKSAYLAGATPLGSVACGGQCTKTAIDRFQKTGRCDRRARG